MNLDCVIWMEHNLNATEMISLANLSEARPIYKKHIMMYDRMYPETKSIKL